MDTHEAKVAAFMTAPRYECVWSRNVIDHAFKKAGIPLIVSGGVFYGQCMQRMFIDAIEHGIEIAITVDFDSCFNVQQVHRLLGVLCSDEKYDAVAAMQCRRGKQTPLFTVGGQTQVEYQGAPIEVTTAHFGLTAIKLDRLRDVPKPWFWSRPDLDGCWTDAKIDDDIWFWNRFREAGRRVWVDIDCRIGHMEEMIAIYDENLQPQHIYPEQWRQQYLERKEQKA
jgi:hypothetical protein